MEQIERILAEIHRLKNELEGYSAQEVLDYIESYINIISRERPLLEDSVAFQKGVQEGRRLEREDALTIADIEKLHTILYAVKNNKHAVFTFTRLSDEQYEEVLQRFNKARKEE